MNETIQTMLNHQSVRQFTNQPLEKDKLQTILRAIQSSPSWINGQQMSIIRVTDPEIRQQLVELCGNQPYIGTAAEFFVFCADFYRSAIACELENEPFAIANNLDLLNIGATDVGIALGTAVVAAESLGLGTVAIGGVRKNMEKVIALLNLPKYVWPVSGLCIGYPSESPGLKPRLPQQAVVFENQYNQSLKTEIEQYNQTFATYMNIRTNGASQATWTEGIARFYREPFYVANSYQDIVPVLKKQGLLKQ